MWRKEHGCTTYMAPSFVSLMVRPEKSPVMPNSIPTSFATSSSSSSFWTSVFVSFCFFLSFAAKNLSSLFLESFFCFEFFFLSPPLWFPQWGKNKQWNSLAPVSFYTQTLPVGVPPLLSRHFAKYPSLCPICWSNLQTEFLTFYLQQIKFPHPHWNDKYFLCLICTFKTGIGSPKNPVGWETNKQTWE